MKPTLAVIVPSFRRTLDLARCLGALERQTRTPDEVVVVYRDTDLETRDLLATRRSDLPLKTLMVTRTGVVAALNAGLEFTRCEIVAFTDDDAAPRPDWLAKIEGRFADDDRIAGVGGRDYIVGQEHHREASRVGEIQWFGRLVGYHHLGRGPARDVEMLKGVNMSFRMRAVGTLRFDERLRGTGAQVHNELAFCLALRRQGWRLIYDPAIAVDHYLGDRFDEDQRSVVSLLAKRNAAFNETITLFEHFGPLRIMIYCVWAFCIGSRDLPGIVQCVRLSLLRIPCWFQVPSVFAGRADAIRLYRKRKANRT